MVEIDLNKLKALDADPKTIQEINFAGNFDQQAKMFLSLKVQKRDYFGFFYKEPQEYFNFILIWYNINIKWLKITL